MSKEYCDWCKDEIKGNVNVFLEILTMIGYEKSKFCSKNCFIEWMIKNYKRKLKRKLKK